MFKVRCMSLGKQVKYYRERLGLTLEELEDRSGVAVGTISALEVRDSSRSKYASALAKALGLTLEQLLDDSEEWVVQPEIASESQHKSIQERSMENNWPFRSISRERYDLLSEKQKDAIEEWVDGQITHYTGRSPGNKSTGSRRKSA
ncbi:helix-turn-helix transcriptional regulator [Pusillimonas sp. SM2304]|uniref:helix-turn-helix domain-containing protein n=1 Tax=Pusillimonas sp. SM2304 TaxID=3073241 RepID=UPI002875CC82|nr:helix-turn-helix transcriptional regulator [Pusillimonas sp. SM2304]MDS1141739.1 helix-turn-helix transcriptional regulator [Pusillimonas sp. SM2304]